MHEYSFVVMPMWSSSIHVGDLHSLKDIVQFIRCLLRGLTYLHEQRIAHRDICELNIVVNFHSPGVRDDDYLELLREHRRSQEVLYALMDYDQSLQLPPDTSLEDCRRPASESAFGAAMYKPLDLSLGEPHYNPFAFDVGMLGMLFRFYFAEAVTELPGLAALLDRMTDHSIPRRFKAAQALLFFDDIVSRLSHDTLKNKVTLTPSIEPMKSGDVYWSKLSAEEMSIWNEYRTPPRPLGNRIFDWLEGGLLYPPSVASLASIV